MVRTFLKQTVLLGLPVLAGIVLYAYGYRDTFPAPRITSNISLNEKLRLFKRTGPERLSVYAAGSSMTLNNLSTRAVQEHFGQVPYVNFGSWGFGLDNTRSLIALLQARQPAPAVIVCANLMEFSTELRGLPLDSAAVARYLWEESEPVAYLRRPQASYYLRQMESNRIRATDPGNYEYLRFDAGGGSTLDVPPERRAKARWQHPPPPADAMVDSAYATVADLGRRLQAQGTQLIWVHTPFREGLMDDALRTRVHAHVDRLRAILTPLGHVVVDGNDRPWPDELFSDYSHFNADGALLFTRHVLAKLER